MRSKLAPMSRRRFLMFGAAACLPLAGCSWFQNNIFKKNDQQSTSRDRPTKESLVSYLNTQSEPIQSLQVSNLAMEAKMGLGVARSIELRGTLQAQRPRNFRLEGYMPGSKSDMVDLGSNDREFWFWVGQGDSPLYHCSYTDLPRAQLPLPIHPEWIMEALGMGTIAPGTNVRMELPRNGNTIELIEQTRSPQGQPMTKVTVFNRNTVSGTQPQVVARKLIDASGKVICMAEIKEMQQDPRTGLLVPYRLDLIYPADRNMDKITLSLVLNTVAVNVPIDPAQAWFQRPNKPGVLAQDLGQTGGPGGGTFRNQSGSGPGAGLGDPRFRGLRRQ
jgi:hypothetical protein